MSVTSTDTNYSAVLGRTGFQQIVFREGLGGDGALEIDPLDVLVFANHDKVSADVDGGLSKVRSGQASCLRQIGPQVAAAGFQHQELNAIAAVTLVVAALIFV